MRRLICQRGEIFLHDVNGHVHAPCKGKLTSSKWAAINKCSADTALRDINELIVLGVLHKTDSDGRSTAYELVTRQHD